MQRSSYPAGREWIQVTSTASEGGSAHSSPTAFVCAYLLLPTLVQGLKGVEQQRSDPLGHRGTVQFHPHQQVLHRYHLPELAVGKTR